MKKILYLALAAIFITLALCSCGNMSVGLGNFEFEHVHYADYAGNSGCATVEKWYDNDSGIEVKTKEFGAMFFSEGTYVMIEDAADCPFCGE